MNVEVLRKIETMDKKELKVLKSHIDKIIEKRDPMHNVDTVVKNKAVKT